MKRLYLTVSPDASLAQAVNDAFQWRRTNGYRGEATILLTAGEHKITESLPVRPWLTYIGERDGKFTLA